MKKNSAIAILGGMGPQASAKMLEVMVSLAASEFGAKDGVDFPEILLDSVPVPDFIANRKSVFVASKMLQNRVLKLNMFDVSCFGIACNTAHILLKDLETISDAPFVSMVDAVCIAVKREGIARVGILATPSTIKIGLYQDALARFSIKVIFPNSTEIDEMEKIIRGVIAGKILIPDSERLKEIAESLRLMGAEGIILGCTEIALIFPKNFSLPVFGSIEILARALLSKHYFKEGKL